MAHDQPTYASVPGIRVYGMMCVARPVDTTPSTIGLTVAHYRTTNEPTTQTASQRKSRPLALRERRSLKRRKCDQIFLTQNIHGPSVGHPIEYSIYCAWS